MRSAAVRRRHAQCGERAVWCVAACGAGDGLPAHPHVCAGDCAGHEPARGRRCRLFSIRLLARLGRCANEAGGGSWGTPSRRRGDDHPCSADSRQTINLATSGPKVRWQMEFAGAWSGSRGESAVPRIDVGHAVPFLSTVLSRRLSRATMTWTAAAPDARQEIRKGPEHGNRFPRSAASAHQLVSGVKRIVTDIGQDRRGDLASSMPSNRAVPGATQIRWII
jgi:hypothetical protein